MSFYVFCLGNPDSNHLANGLVDSHMFIESVSGHHDGGGLNGPIFNRPRFPRGYGDGHGPGTNQADVTAESNPAPGSAFFLQQVDFQHAGKIIGVDFRTPEDLNEGLGVQHAGIENIALENGVVHGRGPFRDDDGEISAGRVQGPDPEQRRKKREQVAALAYGDVAPMRKNGPLGR